jgi:hypothetical protein
MLRKIPRERKSIFKELGLDTDGPCQPYSSEHKFGELTGLASPASTHAPEGGRDDTNTADDEEELDESGNGRSRAQQGQDARDEMMPQSPTSPTSPSASPRTPWYARLAPRVRRPRIKTASSAPPPSLSTMTRLSSIALLIAVLLPGYSYFTARDEVAPAVADAGVIHRRPEAAGPVLETRADSPTDVCRRWAQQGEYENYQLERGLEVALTDIRQSPS